MGNAWLSDERWREDDANNTTAIFCPAIQILSVPQALAVISQ